MRQVKKAQETERLLSLWELCEGKLDGELLYWELWTICKRRFWKRVSLSLRAPSGILKGPQRQVKEGCGNGASVCMGPVLGGTWKEGFFTGVSALNGKCSICLCRGFGRGACPGTLWKWSFSLHREGNLEEGLLC